MLVEVCANSLESALIAQKAGADRIELCSELGVGGITPSHGLIAEVLQRLSIPVHVLIRPRSGHFCYSDFEMAVMQKDIEFCKKVGVKGIVAGVLNKDFTVNIQKTSKLINNSRPMKFTFHRAFDWVPNALIALQQLETMAVDYLLTSGQESTAENGLELLKALHDHAKDLKIMPGSGINTKNAVKFKALGLTVLHTSGTLFENELDLQCKLPMNSELHLAENMVAVTNAPIIRQIVKTVK
ncbi:MAG: copper homeostasis protein CutC [Croceitalea sp.]|nr:copper homeostasis protein CutC [Croceitalea sp.]